MVVVSWILIELANEYEFLEMAPRCETKYGSHLALLASLLHTFELRTSQPDWRRREKNVSEKIMQVNPSLE